MNHLNHHREKACRRRTEIQTLTVMILAISLATVSTAAAELHAEVGRIIEEERTRGGTPAMSVVLVRKGQVVVEHASGFADLETGKVAAVDTLYPAASVSKILTAALVMRQVEKGRLDLDKPVNSYLKPAFWVRDSAGEPVDATLRQLLSHSSGLPVSWNGIIDWGKPVPTLEEHLSQGQRAVHPPGDRIVYANNGFALAGYVAAQAAGQTFADYARDALFRPLGMNRSTFDSPWALEDTLAAAYGHWFWSGSDRTRHANPAPSAPAGGLVTTAPDLARFALMILGEGELDGNRILLPESVAEMLRMQMRAHAESDQGFGLGFAIREHPGQRMAWWDGSLSGAAARLALLPDADIGVVVLSNLANNEPTSVAARRILDAVAPPRRVVESLPSEEELDSLAGFYRPVDFIDPEYWYLNYLLTFEVKRQGGTLLLSSRMFGKRTLTPIQQNHYRISGSTLDDSMVLFDGEEMYMGHIKAARISAWETPAALAAYTVLFGMAVTGMVARYTWRIITSRAAF